MAAATRSAVVTLPASTQIMITRQFDAPRHLVYRAWTTPELIRRWWAGDRGKVTSAEVDLRPGGVFRICMRSSEGVDHWLQGVYREVVEPERLVFTHAWLAADGKPGPETLATITFAETGGKTELTLRQTGFKSTGARDGHQSGWSSTLDRFNAYIVTISGEAQS